jgi:hypothetical protein
MAVTYVGLGNDDGTNFGRSGDKIGFYGLATPIVKATITRKTTVTTSVASLKARVAKLENALSNLGLVGLTG